jgi:hypothetical protein
VSVIQGASYAASYNNAAALAGSAVVLTVTAPDLTVSTPALTVTGSAATASVPATQVGQYLLLWTVTGNITDAVQDQFSVVQASLDLVSLADIKQDLRITPTDTTYDAQLRRWMKAAKGVVERVCGPVLPTTETYTVDGGGLFLVLPRRWVASITTVVETIATVNYTLTEQPLGFSVNNYGYTWDRKINKIVRRGGGGAAICFAPGMQNVAVTYVAGMTVIPEDIQLGANALVKHFFKKGNTPVKSMLRPQQETEMVMVGNYFVPNEVLELITPYALTPGIF